MRVRIGERGYSPAWLGRWSLSLGLGAGRLRVSQVVLERSMAALVLIGLVYIAQQYLALGHLPRPFNSDPSQSLMDFYNTAYWANRSGAYGIWHTVYPPLSLLFARVITHHACYLHSPYDARTCDPTAAWVIVMFYLLNIILVFYSLKRSKVATALPRTFALCLGLPMLYGLELANLILPCFTVFVLAEGGLVRPLWVRQLCQGVAFNFKLYLMVVTAPPALRFRIRWLIGVGLAFLFVYLMTFEIYGSGTPQEIITDLVTYAHGQSNLFFEENHLFAVSARSHEIWNHTLPAILHIGEAMALAAILLGVVSKVPVCRRRLSALSLTLVCSEAALHTQGYSADYTQIFLIFLIFLEKDWDYVSSFLTVISYGLCITGDLTLMHVDSASIHSFFSGRTVLVNFDLNLSQFVRPLFVVLIQAGLSVAIWREAVLPKP